MASVNFKLTGIQEAINTLKSYSDSLKEDVTNILIESKNNIETNAKINAPKNLGTLAQSINSGIEYSDNKITMYVGTPFKYGAYMEFGTGGKVDTRGYDDYASTFRGKGEGTMYEFIIALTEWVKLKGLAGTYSVKTHKRTGRKAKFNSQDNQVAWAIAISILKNGIRPHPFLLPAFESEEDNLRNNINKYLNNAKS